MATVSAMDQKVGRAGSGRRVVLLGLLLFLGALSLPAQPFGGIVARNGITFNGTYITVDSFDSSTNTHSLWQTNLLYHGQPYGIWSNSLSYVSNNIATTPSRTANAHLFTDAGVIDAVGGMIAGYLETGPNGTVYFPSKGSVGDLAWVFTSSGTIANFGLQPGHLAAGMDFHLHSFSLPIPSNRFQNHWLPIPQPTGVIRIGGTWTNLDGAWINIGGQLYTNGGTGFWVNGVNYSLVITNRLENTNFVYYSTSLLSQSILIDAPNVVLYLTNGLNYNINDIFTLNTNADVQIWTTGDIAYNAPAPLNNLGGNAHALSFFDVDGYPVTALFGSSLTANLYLPESSVLFASSGSPISVVGAISCYDLSVNGNLNFHFDESLGVDLPPGLLSPPTNFLVPAGSNATFTVSAGFSPLHYQWFNNHTNAIPDANKTSMTLTNVLPSDAGNYTVIVTNLYGAVTSSASLTVFTNAAARLGNFSFKADNGAFQFYNQGVTGLTYTIQASTDLVNWVPLRTNVSPFTFSDTNAFPRRFYRSVY
ncbi:MAG TPA: immunoglobulin domain-containing protein, partial [Verrucomicrobiae bacterium]|nr:immunoglobulin domain-containing protein [Verrucomicrobiae bacterium]